MDRGLGFETKRMEDVAAGLPETNFPEVNEQMIATTKARYLSLCFTKSSC